MHLSFVRYVIPIWCYVRLHLVACLLARARHTIKCIYACFAAEVFAWHISCAYLRAHQHTNQVSKLKVKKKHCNRNRILKLSRRTNGHIPMLACFFLAETITNGQFVRGAIQSITLTQAGTHASRWLNSWWITTKWSFLKKFGLIKKLLHMFFFDFPVFSNWSFANYLIAIW